MGECSSYSSLYRRTQRSSLQLGLRVVGHLALTSFGLDQMNHSELSHMAGAVDDSTINIVVVITIIIIGNSLPRFRNLECCQNFAYLVAFCMLYKPKFHLARHVTTRHVRRVVVEPMHFGCVELVEQHGSTRRTRVVSRRDVTSQVEVGLYHLSCL